MLSEEKVLKYSKPWLGRLQLIRMSDNPDRNLKNEKCCSQSSTHFKGKTRHMHLQRMVSVVKMVTVLQEYVTEEQRSVVRFLWAKGLNTKIIIKKYFILILGSVCRVKRVSTHW
jgi:hypothetical protein